jgi:alanine racemase
MRPTWIEIDLGAIRDNVAAIAAAVAPARVCAVVKADGYGHGDVPVAEAARDGGAAWLAVALVAEGARLREAGIEGPILLLSEPFPEEVPEIVRWELTPTVYRASFVDALAEVAPVGYPAHLKVDTGMHRVGASPEEAGRLAALIEQKGLTLEGVWTHFAVSEEDPVYTAEQTQVLMGFLGGLAAGGVVPAMLHASNTGGALGHPDARLDMVRAGIGIYGLRPSPGFHPEVPLRPAMRVVSHVSFLQRLAAGERPSYGRVRALPADSTVATVPIGYADGVPRRLREAGGEVLIGGKRYPFAGNVTMDQILVDVGDDPIEVGAEVVLLGAQGGEEITAEEWAELLGTIVYEIVCGFGPRMPRRYHR